jgi:hypothetical protein
MLILSIVVFLFTVAAGLFALVRERAAARTRARASSERDMAVPMTLRRTVGDDSAGEMPSVFQSNVTLWVRVGITVVAAPFVGFIILSKSADAATKNFAFTTVGTILGFWLSASSK